MLRNVDETAVAVSSAVAAAGTYENPTRPREN